MTQLSPLLDELIKDLQCLPGVGQKSAQRMALHLLSRDRSKGLALANSLQQAMSAIGKCNNCRNYTEQPVCAICSNPNREASVLCVVENALDVIAIEQAGNFNGYYFVLHGHISPLDGIGPDALELPRLIQLVAQQQVAEVILATNATIEGEATAHYIVSALKNLTPAPSITRIAHGIPVGGELEMINSNTLSYALADRRPVVMND